MIEALRSRPDVETLDRVTPAFATYAEKTGRLAEALRLADWRSMGAEAQVASETRAEQQQGTSNSD